LKESRVVPKTKRKLSDDFLCISDIGSGSYSEVKLYQSKADKKLNVAVKCMHKVAKTQDMRGGPYHEMQIMAQLDHPCIPKYFD
jgi:serine/threonine protein kinase